MSETQITEYVAADGSQVKLTRGIVAKYILTGDGTASDKDIFSFIAKCKSRGLNPLAGDAYMVCYRDKNGKSSTPNVIVSKDYYVSTAQRQEDFNGFQAGIIVETESGDIEFRDGSFYIDATENLLGGWAKAYRKGVDYPVTAAVNFSEYSTGRSMWRPAQLGGKPATMIRKVALVQALRETYPSKFAGLYDAAEMPEHQKPVIGENPKVEVEGYENIEVMEVEATVEPASENVQVEVEGGENAN